MSKKVAIKKSTLGAIGEAVRNKEGSTDLIPVNALADRIGALPTASGENKLAQFVEGALTEITAEDLEGITEIRSYAFYYAPITTIQLPNTITTIYGYSFNNSKIERLVFPNSITLMQNNICSGCSKLKSVVLPENTQITAVPQSMFSSCYELDNVVIPNSITLISGSAFYNCSKLSNLTLSNALTEIGSSAFLECKALINLTLPATLTQIGGSALQCGTTTNKATITFLRTTPPTITTSTFKAIYLNKIIVPAGCGDAYKNATNWANFADYIEEATV